MLAVLSATSIAQAQPPTPHSLAALAEPHWAQALTWRRSAPWTGALDGPRDAQNRAWFDPDFDDSAWAAVELPDGPHPDGSVHDRYFRARFAWDGQTSLRLSFVSDDGLAIFINGQRVGEWGQGWRKSGCVNAAPSCLNTQAVPALVIPETALRTGDNVLAVDTWNGPDAGFGFLNFTYLDMLLYGSRPPINPTHATPVILVHGWRGNPAVQPGPQHCTLDDRDRFTDDEVADAYFSRLDADLAPHYPVYYAHLISNPCYTPPLADNARHLKATLERVKNAEQLRTGQRPARAILIGHSMGGLVIRAYVEGGDYAGDVEAIFTLGTPHQGVPIESLISYLKLIGARAEGLGYLALGLYCLTAQPVVCEFTETGMRLFNLRYRQRKGVHYYSVSGDAPFSERNALGQLMGALIEGPDDGLITTSSGNGLVGATYSGVSAENHGSFGPNTYFRRGEGALEPSASFLRCIKRVLVDASLGAPCTLDPPSASNAAGDDYAQHTPLHTDALAPNQTITRVVTVGGGPALFAASWLTGSVDFTLVDPNGMTIDPAYVAANPAAVTYAADGLASTYRFTQSVAGEWVLQLRAGGLPASGTEVSTLAAFGDGVSLSIDSDTAWYQPGGAAVLTATLAGSVASAVLTATVIRADGAIDPVSMVAIGAGQYRGAYAVPNAPGYAHVRVLAAGVASTGAAFERESSRAFQISPSTASLRGVAAEAPIPYPSRPDLYQSLDIAFDVNASATLTVALTADLVDAAGTPVGHATHVQSIAPGSTPVTLRFAGAAIRSAGRDGPYQVQNVVLMDPSAAPLILDAPVTPYTTLPYEHTDFGQFVVHAPMVMR